MHRTLCPQTASVTIADVITTAPRPRHTKLMCLLDPSAFTMGAGSSRQKAKRPEGLLGRLSVGTASPNKGATPGKAPQIKVCFVQSFVHACIHPYVCLFIWLDLPPLQYAVHSFTHSCILFISSSTHPPTLSCIQALMPALVYSCPHSALRSSSVRQVRMRS